ncbi:unnamed protein product [Moneuplotes crassus]|uniref:Uncharacterized protein n=1 Tax=Euplotes crassus TaxID=5936 RepID=A0AAD2D4W8_EUPCR|nr:unnamed protein product [Moneuplotes crassus]
MTLLTQQRALMITGQKKRTKKAQKLIAEKTKLQEKQEENNFGTMPALNPEEAKKRKQKQENRKKYMELWEKRKDKIMLRPAKYQNNNTKAKEGVQKDTKHKKLPNEVEKSVNVEKKRAKILKRIRSVVNPVRGKNKRSKRQESGKTLGQEMLEQNKLKNSVVSSFVKNMK